MKVIQLSFIYVNNIYVTCSLETYNNRRQETDAASSEMLGELSALEKKLAEQHSVLEIRGKVSN